MLQDKDSVISQMEANNAGLRKDVKDMDCCLQKLHDELKEKDAQLQAISSSKEKSQMELERVRAEFAAKQVKYWIVRP